MLLDYKSNLKLCDYGIMEPNSKTIEHLPCSNLDFIAPEILMFRSCNDKVDIWSLGAILYTLAFRKKPFAGNSLKEKLDNMVRGKMIEFSHDYSTGFKTLLKKLLKSNPDERPSIGHVFKDEWFESMTKDLNIDMHKYRTKKIERSNNNIDDDNYNKSYTTYSKISSKTETSSEQDEYEKSVSIDDEYEKSKLSNFHVQKKVSILGCIEIQPEKIKSKNEILKDRLDGSRHRRLFSELTDEDQHKQFLRATGQLIRGLKKEFLTIEKEEETIKMDVNTQFNFKDDGNNTNMDPRMG